MNNKFFDFTDDELIDYLTDELAMHELLYEPALRELLYSRPCINLFTLIYYFTSDVADELPSPHCDEAHQLLKLVWDGEKVIPNPDRDLIAIALSTYMEII